MADGSRERSDSVPLRDHLETVINDFRKHVDQRFDDQQKAVEAALAAQEKAVKAASDNADKADAKADKVMQQWQANANEWRQTMDDRERKFLPREEAAADRRSTDLQIKELKESKDRLAGGTERSNLSWDRIVSVVMAILVLAGLIWEITKK